MSVAKSTRFALLLCLSLPLVGCPDGKDDGDRPATIQDTQTAEVAPIEDVDQTEVEQDVADEPDELTPPACAATGSVSDGSELQLNIGMGAESLSDYSCPELAFSDFDGKNVVFDYQAPCDTTVTVEAAWAPGAAAQDLAIAILTECAADTCQAAGLAVAGKATVTLDVEDGDHYFVSVDSRGDEETPFTLTLNTTGCCVPACDGKTCGDDGCGGTCGVCDDGLACVDGQCACAPQCGGKECGDDGCGGTCGPGCDDGDSCADGQCCQTQCDGKVCGDDGCGGTCGPGCDDGIACIAGQCGCTPQCDGKVCGADGCGGTCDPGCAPGEACSATGTSCTPIIGSSCGVPIVIDPGALPFTSIGDTLLFQNLLSSNGGCGVGADLGDQAADVVFSFTPAVSGDYEITMPGYSAGDANLVYVVTDCTDTGDTCIGFNDFAGSTPEEPETMVLPLEAGTPIYIVVDGLSSNEQGPYRVALDLLPLPGESCENAILVTGADLPYLHSTDTTLFENDYNTEAGCSSLGNLGDQEADVVYRFLPDETGQYVITMPDFINGLPSLVYIVSECDDPNGTCLGFNDFFGSTGDAPESLIVDLNEGVSYFIVVDSLFPNEEGPYNFAIDKSGLPGEDCESAIVIDPAALPYTDSGDTTQYGNDLSTSNGCGTTGDLGDNEADVVYSFTPTVAADYVITMPGFNNGDASLAYVVRDCDDVQGTCLMSHDFFGSTDADPESLIVPLNPNTTVFIVVDSLFPDEQGDYAIQIDMAAPQGSDCDAPIEINPAGLPYTGAGTTVGFGANVSTQGGCGVADDLGVDAEETVYRFVPAISGDYRITMPGVDAGDARLIYVVRDCADPNGTCVGLENFDAAPTNPQDLTMPLEAGTSYRIVVDGSGPYQFLLRLLPVCVPACTDKVCGDDGCGGTCGTCLGDSLCTDDGATCLLPGDTCALPFVVDGIPYTDAGDTSGFNNDYNTQDGCGLGTQGEEEPDVVYEFTPATAGDYRITLPGFTNGDPSLVYVTSDCGAVGAACIGGNDFWNGAGQPEELIVSLDAGIPYQIVLDSAFALEVGPYAIQIDEACTPVCGGLACGDDGCGGTCGTCAFDETCSADQTACVAAGDTCETAIHIDPAALPFVHAADLTTAADDYSTQQGCATFGNPGAGSGDIAYSLTPILSGEYHITLPGFAAGAPSLVYVTADCADIGGQCSGYLDFFGSSDADPAVLSVNLDAGVPYHIIVDALFPAEEGPYTVQVDRAPVEGDNCTDPFEIHPATLPATVSGATTGFTNDFSTGAACGSAGDIGDQEPDVVYTFAPELDGTYRLTMPGFESGDPSVLFVAADCADAAGSCLGYNDFFGTTDAAPETLDIPMTAGVVYHIIVDSFLPDEVGPYLFRLEKLCEPDCSGKVCGDDGCGGTCGACDVGDSCSADGAVCLPAGDQCETALPVGPLPFIDSGDTTNATNDYSTQAGCGSFGDIGNNEPDIAYKFTPTETGIYEITMPGFVNGNPSVIYVVSDCADTGGACVAYQDFFGTSDAAPGTLTVQLDAGVPYFVIIDSFFPNEVGPYTVRIDKVELPGDTCDNAIVIDPSGLPATVIEDTTLFSDTLSTLGGCGTGNVGAGQPDVIYRFTPDVTGEYDVSMPGFADGNPSAVYVITDCGHVATTCKGYNDFFGSTDAAPEGITLTLDAGTTYFIVVDSLFPSEVGPFGLRLGQGCVPSCTGKACGDDGCGATCGTCGAGSTCDAAGQCLLDGDACQTGFEITANDLPYLATGDTTSFNNDYDSDFGCGSAAAVGDGEADVVYTFTPGADGDYIITMPGFLNGVPSVVYVTTDCADVGGSCLGYLDFFASSDANPASLTVPMLAGVPYHIIIDSFTVSEQGPYQFELTGACVPECTGLVCGDDGCGGSCGACGDGELCATGGASCLLAGDTCENALLIDSLPYEHSADNSLFTNDLSTQSGCDSFGDIGDEEGDVVYAFTPTSSGAYSITMPGFANGDPSVVYVLGACGDPAGSCTGFNDFFGSSPLDPESLVVTLTAGQTYFIVVDSFFPGEQGPYTLRVEPFVQQGDTCADPFVITPAELPYDASGDNSQFANDYNTQGGCSVGIVGKEEGDVVYSFTPDVDGSYRLTMPGFANGDPSVLYLTTDCSDIATACAGYNDFFDTSGVGENLTLDLVAGTTYFIIQDSLVPSEQGPYAFRLELVPSCVPDCTGKVCADDLCGGTCGVCQPGTTCIDDGAACVPPGGSCADATAVGPLPWEHTGDTSLFTDAFVGDGGCGQPADLGGGIADTAYVFVPDADGEYDITMPGFVAGQPQLVTVASDCADTGNTCVGFNGFAGSDVTPEVLTVTLVGGTAYTIIVDGGTAGPYTLRIAPAAPPGDTCEDALVIDPAALPFVDTQDNALFGNSYSTQGGCATGDFGDDEGDVAYAFTPTVTGDYAITMPGFANGNPSIAYVVADCADTGGSCVGYYDFFGSSDAAPEALVVTLTSGIPYFIIVDSFTTAEEGPFTVALDLANVCVPDCGGKVCGEDGCGGSCGACAGGQACATDGSACLAAGDNCAAPFVIGALPFETSGDTAVFNDDVSTDGGCGAPGDFGAGQPDVIYSFTPGTSGDYVISMPGYSAGDASLLWVTTSCADTASSCVVFNDFTDSTPGAPETITAGLTGGVPYFVVISSHGGEAGAYSLRIEPLGIAGDTCQVAVVIPAAVLPVQASGNNTGAGNDYSTGGGCGTGDLGDNEPDVVFVFEPTITGDYLVTMPGFENGDASILYIVEDCANTGSTCIAYNDYFGSSDANPEVLTVPLEAGKTYFVIVDSFLANEIGDFTVQIDLGVVCVPQCGGKICGDDSCGGLCGTCGGGEVCTGDGAQCLAMGDTCGDAIPISAGDLPFSGSGDTTNFTNDYSSFIGCGSPGNVGSGEADVVYAFTPTVDGPYDITMPGWAIGAPSIAYITTDCADIINSCVGYHDFFGATPETMTVNLIAGVTYFVIIDSFLASEQGPYTIAIEAN